MKLSPREIAKIADLARLELTEKEQKMYAGQLSVVLDYVEQLNEVKTEGVPETCQVTGLMNAAREDKIQKCDPDTTEKIIEQFPEKKGGLLKVKAVF